jgi:predicted TIM-barrel fold metal-dependent hydrolase
MTVVDCHTHGCPRWVHEAFHAWLAESGSLEEGPAMLWRSPAFADPVRQTAALDEHGIETALLTHSSNAIAAMHSAALHGPRRRTGAETIALVNDELRGWAAASGGRLQATRWVDPRLPDSALAEIERSTIDGGVPAISMHTAYADRGDRLLRFLDDPEFEPVLAAAESAGVTVFVHASAKFVLASEPPLVGLAGSCLIGGLSMLVENTLCIARLVLSGTFDQHPALRLVFGQLGGVFPIVLGRFDVIRRLLSQAGDDIARASGVLPKLRDYAEHIYVDTHSMDASALGCALDALGPERIVFGSDYPVTPGHLGRADGLAVIRSAALRPDELYAIESGNAQHLLQLACQEVT